jgi:hypothetical protein
MVRSELVDDELWELVKSLLPDRTPQRTGRPSQRPSSVHGDRVRAEDRGAMAAGSSAGRLLWGDRLAAASGVAASGGVGESAPRTPPPSERRQPN